MWHDTRRSTTVNQAVIKNYNDIDKQLQDKLNQIDEQVQKLKQEDWSTNMHGIYCKIQSIRNKEIEPLKTLNKDDI